MSDIQTKGADELFCPACGAVIKNDVTFCPHCGKPPNAAEKVGKPAEEPGETVNAADVREHREQRWLTTLLLCIFLGGLGAHRFYVGKIGTAILMIVTLGGVGIWWLIDLIVIIVCKFRDKQGNYITYGPAR